MKTGVVHRLFATAIQTRRESRSAREFDVRARTRRGATVRLMRAAGLGLLLALLACDASQGSAAHGADAAVSSVDATVVSPFNTLQDEAAVDESSVADGPTMGASFGPDPAAQSCRNSRGRGCSVLVAPFRLRRCPLRGHLFERRLRVRDMQLEEVRLRLFQLRRRELRWRRRRRRHFHVRRRGPRRQLLRMPCSPRGGSSTARGFVRRRRKRRCGHLPTATIRLRRQWPRGRVVATLLRQRRVRIRPVRLADAVPTMLQWLRERRMRHPPGHPGGPRSHLSARHARSRSPVGLGRVQRGLVRFAAARGCAASTAGRGEAHLRVRRACRGGAVRVLRVRRGAAFRALADAGRLGDRSGRGRGLRHAPALSTRTRRTTRTGPCPATRCRSRGPCTSGLAAAIR